MIKDQLMNNKDQKIVFSYCNTCLLKGHNFLTCNKMHYIPDKDFLIKKYVFCNPTLQRQIFARRGNKSKNALSNKINFQKLYKILDYKEFSSLMMQNELEQFEEEDKDEKNIISILEGKDLRELTSGKTNELKENTYVSHTKQWSYSESGFKKNASKDEIRNIENENSFCISKSSPKNSSQIFIMDFDKATKLEFYHPENNLENIVSNLDNYWYHGRKKGKMKKKIIN